ncbi:hypothetical protein BDW02DRAFT_580781 [Decorospora gaudefroyi]|uniref:Uncharacterized protein n=1 Tax=Decorospora gaudefroyi TaxID=184978 RepID=A0A6A5KHU0_9PLEO|nr:hypothetical protein BDW02DRAFT_580781 [Decorospora gaudefroyi]
MLTYERLLTRIETLFTVAADNFPSEENEERRHLLQAALESVKISSRAGLEGSQNVLSPGQLKHWLVQKIKTIHERFDGPHEDEPAAAANNKRKRGASATPAPKRRKKSSTVTAEDRAAATALLALSNESRLALEEMQMPPPAPPSDLENRATPPSSSSSFSSSNTVRQKPRMRTQPPPPPSNQDLAVRDVGRKRYTSFPPVDRTKGPKETFLAGVVYAMDNVPRANAPFKTSFSKYVRAELGFGAEVVRTVEWSAEELMVAYALVEMRSGAGIGGQDGGQAAAQPAGQAVRNSFWNVI